MDLQAHRWLATIINQPLDTDVHQNVGCDIWWSKFNVLVRGLAKNIEHNSSWINHIFFYMLKWTLEASYLEYAMIIYINDMTDPSRW